MEALEINVAVPETYDLERTVCSHGFFMMAPNRWDPLSRTFSRPLRLSPSHSLSVLVSVSQPQPLSLLLRIHTPQPQLQDHHDYILAQLKRMLRLSEQDEKTARDFQRTMINAHTQKQECSSACCGRVFRSPTLFEDMVKSIILCNCQLSPPPV